MKLESSEQRESLWRLVASPAIWAAHFLLCYIVASIWCAKVAERDTALRPVSLGIAALTLLSLIAVLVIGWQGYRRHRLPGGALPHDADTPEDRHRFLGFATVLLSGLSAIAICFEALVPVFIRSCR